MKREDALISFVKSNFKLLKNKEKFDNKIFDAIMKKHENPELKNGKIEIIFEIPKQETIKLSINPDSLIENEGYYTAYVLKSNKKKE